MGYVGSLRHRLIRDSMFNYVSTNLAALGWTTATAWHQAVTIRPEAINSDNEIVTNLVCLADEGVSEQEWEFGSQFAEHVWECYWDVYGETDTIGQGIVQDIRDLLAGRYAGQIVTAGQGPTLQVYDYTQNPPTPVFTVDIVKIASDRSNTFSHQYARCWYSVQCHVADYYGVNG